MSLEEVRTEAQVIRQTALESVEPFGLDPEILYHIVVPEGATREVIDLDQFLDAPRRKRGSVELHTQESFAKFVKEHLLEDTTHLYADREKFCITAIFNDAAKSDPGWGDHRAVLPLKHTPEWTHWASQDGKLLDQTHFAEHIETGLNEIVSPDGASMLELAQSFHVSTGAEFSSATILDNGSRKFSYAEENTARAGARGDVTIPKQIELGIIPFEVETGQPYRLKARLRYRLSSGHLSLGYQIIRPHDVLRTAFGNTVTWIGDDTSLYPLLAKAPAGN